MKLTAKQDIEAPADFAFDWFTSDDEIVGLELAYNDGNGLSRQPCKLCNSWFLNAEVICHSRWIIGLDTYNEYCLECS